MGRRRRRVNRDLRKEPCDRFIKGPEEIAERYGDKRYRPVGRAKIKAMVVNDEEAIFTPCTYSVSDVSFIRGRGVSGLTEFVSYRGRFGEQARQGETLVASGKLEVVSTKGGGTHHRLVVGGHPRDYLLVEEA